MKASPLSYCALIVALFAAAPIVRAQTPLGSGVTYQGQLKQSGTPANGTFPMVFTLWNGATGGTQIGPTLTFDGAGSNPPPVVVTDGLFTVLLDFGAAAYNGDARWVEVVVSGTTLAPRQPLTTAPYARFSSAPWATGNGGIVSYSGGNVGIGTTSPDSLLDLLSNSPSGTGIGFKNPPNDGTAWSIRADGNGLPNNRYSFRIRDEYQGLDRLTIEGWENGRVGIGTSAPAAKLHVSGGPDFEHFRIDAGSPSGTWFNLNNSSTGGPTWNMVSTGSGTPEGAGKLLFRANAATKMAIDGSGNTVTFGGLQAAGSNPLAHTQGAYLEWNKEVGTGATYLLNQKGNGFGGFVFGEVSTANVVTDRMRIDGNGRVGIGAFPFNNNLLTVNGDTYCNGTVTSANVFTSIVDSAVLKTDSRVQWGTDSQNSDIIKMDRIDIANDRTALRLTIGDNPGGGANAYDEFQIFAGNSFQFDFTSDGRAFKVGFPGWETLSDARSKRDIEPLTGALDRVLQLRGRTFFYNDPKALGARRGKCTGFIAQEVESVMPEWVGEEFRGLKTLHISGFEALTVEALRDLRQEKDSEIAALRTEKDAQIAVLQQENDQLAARLPKLETLIEKLADK